MRLSRGVFSVRYFSLTWMAVLALLVSFASGAFAQSATGTITGTITDQKGLAMVGVNVQIHNVDTGVDLRPVATNDQGVYQVPLLQPGTYDITVSQTGFSTVKRASVALQVGATARIDIEMPVSATQTLVTVTTEIPLLETEKTDQSQNVSEALVSNLPVSSRRWEQFALLTPGVNPDGVNGGMSFHGINNLYNNNSVDGANNNYNYDGGSRGGTADGYVYSGDSIREFQVASSGFNAEVGQSAGGAVNAVTKSGTNQLHGDLFYNGRAANFNAIDPVNAASAISQGKVPTQTIHQQHQYGASVGGPLWKDKLFFFATVDGYRKVNPQSSTTNQLSPTINQLTCPTAIAATPAATAAAMPTAAQCQAAKDFINAHFLGDYDRGLRQNVELLKFDAQVNQSNHLSGVTNIRDWKQATDPALLTQNPTTYLQSRFAIANWNMVIGSNKVNELRYQYGVDNSFNSLNGGMGMPGVQLTNMFTYGLAAGGSSWTKEFRHQVSDSFSWTKGTHSMKFGVDMNFITDDARSSVNSGGPYQYSSATLLPTDIGCTAPGANPSSATVTNQGEFCNWLIDTYRVPTSVSVGSTVVNTTGRHWDNFNQFYDNIEPGYPSTFRYIFPNDDYAGFFNDTWKVRPNLTINWGLRYDLQVITDLPNSVKHVCAEKPEVCVTPPGATSPNLPIFDTYTDEYPNEYTAIQPRVGAAWNIAPNTVVRFSGGIFFAKTEGHNIKNVISGAGETTTNCSTKVPTAGSAANLSPLAATCPSTGATNLQFPNVYFNQQNSGLWSVGSYLPGVPVAAQTPILQPPTSITLPNPTFGIRGVDPTLRRPRVYTVTAAVEQRLPGNMNLSISYVWTRGIALPRGRDFNIGPNRSDPNYCSNSSTTAGGQTCGIDVKKSYDVVDTNGVTQTSLTLPFYTSRPAIAAGTGIVAAPTFNSRVDARTGVINGNSSDADSHYNGLIISLRKPMSHGLEVLGNYTLSKATDNGQQGGGNSGEGQVGIPAIDPYNNRAEEGFTGTDTRHRFTSSVVYQPGFERYAGNSGVKKQLLGGWQLATTFTAQSGSHYTAQIQGSTARPLVVTGFTPGSTASTTFTYSPLDGSMGGAGVNSPGAAFAGRAAWLTPGQFVLPSLYNLDLRLEKIFNITERYHIAIRGEAFNVLNSTQFLAVSQNAYSYATPSATGAAAKTCPTSAVAGALTPHATTAACMVPVATFGQPTTTTGNLVGARQLQAGIRFEF